MRTWYQSLPTRNGDLIEGINGFTIVRGNVPSYHEASFEPAPGMVGLPASDAFYAFQMLNGETIIIQEGEILDYTMCDLEDFHFTISNPNVASPLEYTISGRGVVMHAFVPASLAVFEYLDSLCTMANMGLGIKEVASLHQKRDVYEKMLQKLKAQFGDAFDISKLKEISDEDGRTVFHYEAE